MEQQASTKKSAKIKGIIAGVAAWFVIGSIGNVLVSLLGNIAIFVIILYSYVFLLIKLFYFLIV